MTRILFVDDEPLLLNGLRRSLRSVEDWECRFAGGVAEAWAILEAEPIDLVVSDLDMPMATGIDLLQRVRTSARTRGIPFFLLTGNIDPSVAEAASQGGLTGVLAKPCSRLEMETALRRGLGE